MANGNGRNGNGKLTPLVRRTLLTAIGKGCTDTEACAIAGISRETLRQWSKRKEPQYVALLADITRAREERIASLLDRIAKAGDDDWRALAWLASKAKPAQFSDKHIVAHEGGIGVKTEPVEVRIVTTDPGATEASTP